MATIQSLLEKADYMAIEYGRLVIDSPMGKEQTAKFISKNEHEIICKILETTGRKAYFYDSYKTNYWIPENRNVGGVCLQFYGVLDEEESLFKIFNVDLNRARTTKAGKKGSPLPKGCFRSPKKGNFLKFWDSTGIKRPARLSSFNDYMGKLGDLFYSCKHNSEGKIELVVPLSVSYGELCRAYNVTNKTQTNPRQQTDNNQTRLPDKESQQRHRIQGAPLVCSTDESFYGKEYSRGCGSKESSPLPNNVRESDKPKDYDQTEKLGNVFPLRSIR